MHRRTLITVVPVVTLGALAGFNGRALAEGKSLTPLDSTNAAARALHYVDDTADADPAVYKGKSDQNCSNCMHYQGSEGNARGGCALFPGYSVAAKGWCSGWVEKT